MTADKNQAKSNLESVTDYVKEEEVAETNADQLKKAVTEVQDRLKERSAQQAARNSELAKVQIKQEDVDLLAEELELSKDEAELCLRESGGDVKIALRTLINR